MSCRWRFPGHCSLCRNDKKIQNIIKSFPIEDVYDSDETSFYYKQIAKGSYCANKF